MNNMIKYMFIALCHSWLNVVTKSEMLLKIVTQ